MILIRVIMTIATLIMVIMKCYFAPPVTNDFFFMINVMPIFQVVKISSVEVIVIIIMTALVITLTIPLTPSP